MYKKLHLKIMILLCALVAGGSAWADEVVYKMTPDATTTGSDATSYITTLTEFTHDGISWKMNQWNPKTLQIKTNQNSAASEFRFYNTSAFSGRIKSVVITFSALTVSDASKLMFLGGSSEVTATTGGTAGTWNSTTKTLTWTPGESDNFTYFAFYQNGKAASGTNNLAEDNAIVVTYESGSDNTKTATTVTIDANGITNTDVYTGTAAGSLSATVTADGSAISGASFTWSSSDPDVATIDANGTVTLVAAGTTTITASYAGDDTYAASSATYELTVTDSTPYEGGDITFDATVDIGTSPLTKNEVNFTCSNGALDNVSEYRLYANSTTTFSLSQDIINKGYKITSIVFTDVEGYLVSNFSNPTISPTVANGGVSNWNKDEKTWTGEATSVSFKAGSQVRCTQIVVTVEKPKVLSSIAITTAPTKTTYTEGETFDPTGMVVTATYTDETTAAVTGYTYSPNGALTTNDTQITVSYTLGEVTATATQTITVNEAPSHTVTFSVDGTTTTESVKEGQTIPFPTVTAPTGYTLMGWTGAAITGVQATAPTTLVQTATMGTSDVTYYAVFAVVTTTPQTGTYTLDYNEEGELSSKTLGYGNAVEYTATDGGQWVIKAYKNQGMQINMGKDASIKVPNCAGNIQSVAITGSTAKAVGFSASDYTGSETITYLAEGTDATSQTLDLSNQNVTTGYIVPKSGNIVITKIVITYDNTIVNASNYCTTIPVTSVTVNITSAGMATFCSDQALDFTGFTDMYAYIAKYNDGKVTYHRVNKVPANTGVMLRNPNSAAATQNVPVLSGDADNVTGNMFIGTLEEINTLASATGSNTNYILNNGSNGLGFYKANNQKLGAGKAYLQLPTDGAKSFIGFDEEGVATAINAIESEQISGNIYDLQGREVKNPAKGIYVVNGKKVVIK